MIKNKIEPDFEFFQKLTQSKLDITSFEKIIAESKLTQDKQEFEINGINKEVNYIKYDLNTKLTHEKQFNLKDVALNQQLLKNINERFSSFNIKLEKLNNNSEILNERVE